jgi:hypothetical protein
LLEVVVAARSRRPPLDFPVPSIYRPLVELPPLPELPTDTSAETF